MGPRRESVGKDAVEIVQHVKGEDRGGEGNASLASEEYVELIVQSQHQPDEGQERREEPNGETGH